LGYQVWDDQTTKFTQLLAQGKNLISIPIKINNTDVSTVLQTINYNSAWWYDPWDANDPWKSYNPLKSFNDLSTVNNSMAIWIDVASDSWFTVTGSVLSSTDIKLKVGWNLIGYPSLRAKPVATVLSLVPYERVEGFNVSAPQRMSVYGDGNLMNAGYGFWVKISADSTLIVS